MGPTDAPETGVSSSFELLRGAASFQKDDVPTVHALREAFPYQGRFHFRAKIPAPPPHQQQEHCWLDLSDNDAPLPVWAEHGAQQCVYVRALPLVLPPPGEDEEEGELDYSGPDLDEDIAKAVASASSSSMYDNDEEEREYHRRRNSSNGSQHGASWSQQLKEVGETVLTSDVARDLTKKGLKVGKQVGKQVNKLWKMVGEGLAGGPTSGGSGEDYPSSPLPPSPSAIRYLRRWEEALVTPPDTELLHALWDALFPHATASFAARSPQWRAAGFQGEDPVGGGDLRGTGSVCVHFLVYFARTYPNKAQAILRAQEEAEAGDPSSYPLAGVANNLTLMLADLFKLREGRYVHSHTVFWPLFEGGGFGTMEEVFCAALGYLDRRWVETGASREDFPRLVQQTRGRIETVLGQSPTSLPHWKALADQAGLYIE